MADDGLIASSDAIAKAERKLLNLRSQLGSKNSVDEEATMEITAPSLSDTFVRGSGVTFTKDTLKGSVQDMQGGLDN